ncbi:MAG: DNA repair protein RecN [Sterolibacterium sp.]|nr:DNA repair protein RecN [Sterolibacterium sp.]MBP9799375.1 DNA repair protein RecN [Sterolibacterium sp.]
MLQRLYIRDFIIVDRLELDFGAGFTTLTGETGAGKSILIDALSLALGERAESGVVRPGSERAEVCAEFHITADSPLNPWLTSNDFPLTEEASCLLRRIVDTSGRSRAYINGAPATLGQLRTAAEFLCDIHGQHAHHSLLRNDAQRELLDAHAGLTALAREVAEKYRLWHKLSDACYNAERDAAATLRERELLASQLQELQTLAFDPQQWQEDNREHHRLSHAATLIEGTQAALNQLEDDEQAITPQLDTLLTRLRSLHDYDATLSEPLELLDGARIQLQEASHALHHYQRRLDLDPQRLGELEARISGVLSAARKHRIPADELPELLARQQSRLDELALLVDVAALTEQAAAAEKDYQASAKKLTAGRHQTAALLSQQVTDAMQQLALAGGRFDITLKPLAEGTAHGLENVEFQVAANAGQPPRALAKAASGGELSRIGLAIQVIASQAAQIPTLIFDEVDVGIGGRVAEIVGRMLHDLGRRRQVLCVTHLPQVAACADQQWNIAKEERNQATYSRVTPLDRAGRIDELARMLGGLKITATTRRHAAEMLDAH